MCCCVMSQQYFTYSQQRQQQQQEQQHKQQTESEFTSSSSSFVPTTIESVKQQQPQQPRHQTRRRSIFRSVVWWNKNKKIDLLKILLSLFNIWLLLLLLFIFCTSSRSGDENYIFFWKGSGMGFNSKTNYYTHFGTAFAFDIHTTALVSRRLSQQQKVIIRRNNNNNNNRYNTIQSSSSSTFASKRLSLHELQLTSTTSTTLFYSSPIPQSRFHPFLLYRNNEKKKSQKRLIFMSTSSSLSSTMMIDNNNNHTRTPTTTMNIRSNQEWAQERLQNEMSERQERKQLIVEKQQRNLQLKEQLYSNNQQQDGSSNGRKKNTLQQKQQENDMNNLIAIKVTVCTELRNELKLSGREKRGRIFLSQQSNATSSIYHLQRELYQFFRALKKNTYTLQASLLSTPSNEEISSTTNNNNGTYPQNMFEKKWNIETDEDVQRTFQLANLYFQQEQQQQLQQQLQQNDMNQNGIITVANDNTNNDTTTNEPNDGIMKRPSLILYVNQNPYYVEEQKKKQRSLPYLINLPNPDDSPTITMLSFYSFGTIQNPNEFATELRKLFLPFHALGRIYIATEGINAQMSVPTNVLPQFIECCEYYLPDTSISEYLRTKGNGVNIDPIPLTIIEFQTAGIPANSNMIGFVQNNEDGNNDEQDEENKISSGTNNIVQPKPTPPFTNLHIRVRQQIVTDGLQKSYNWDEAGYDMPPLEWHKKLQQIQEAKEKKEKATSDEQIQNKNHTTTTALPILLDCRNTYETDVGIFEGAIPLQTNTFKDTWDAIHEQLANQPKDTPIMMYCTGGIRCVKVGAYVTQEMGFTNVSRLAGGIIAYDRALSTELSSSPPQKTNHGTIISGIDDKNSRIVENEQYTSYDESKTSDTVSVVTTTITKPKSMFKGTNFVFDGRLGRKITDDALGKCVTCGANATYVSNCRNNNCHKRMVQCNTCQTNYSGTCSELCNNRVRMLQQKQQMKNVNQYGLLNEPSSIADLENTKMTDASVQQPVDTSEKQEQPSLYGSLDSYSIGHSSPLPNVYAEMEYNSKALIPTGSHMVSGPAQGRLLKQLASMTREGRVLELGTFTGYATAFLLEGAIDAGRCLDTKPSSNDSRRTGGPYVLSMERDAKAYEIAVDHIQVLGQYGYKSMEASEAICSLRHPMSSSSSSSLNEKKKFTTNTVNEDNLKVTSISTHDDIALCELVKVTDALAVVEEMAVTGGIRTGRFTEQNTKNQNDDKNKNIEYIAPFDMVFVDADKTRLLDYVEACLVSDRVLKKGGLIVVDNVLWKGLVLDVNNNTWGTRKGKSSNSGSMGGNDMGHESSSDSDSDDHDDDTTISPTDNNNNNNNNNNVSVFESAYELRKNRRARKLANIMHRFNQAIVLDERVDVLVLPLRDGLSIIRKL